MNHTMKKGFISLLLLVTLIFSLGTAYAAVSTEVIMTMTGTLNGKTITNNAEYTAVPGQKVEVTIPLKNFILRAEETQDDVYAAVDVLVNNIERQIRKNKTKIQSQSIKNYKNERNFAMNVIDEIDEDEDEEDKFKIVKRKTIEAKPMSEEEAILQMELLGHQFYMYKDADTDKYAVVYKRKDNHYGIIESE